MSAGTSIGSFLKRAVVFFIDSTLFGAVAVSAVTYATIILTRNPLTITLLLLPFFAFILIYSINRLSDREEDAINLPDRSRFPPRVRIILLGVSLVFYLVLLSQVLQKNLLSCIIGVVPLVIALLYSVFRLKRVFLVKNVSIAMAFGASVLIVPAYYDTWTGTEFMLFLFFFLTLLTNTIMFDCKDIRGDRICGIRTLPVLWGIPRTKLICYLLLAGAFILIIPLVFINQDCILLVPYTCTLALSTVYAPEGEQFPWWYYGLLVDGEFWVLLFSTLGIVLVR